MLKNISPSAYRPHSALTHGNHYCFLIISYIFQFVTTYKLQVCAEKLHFLFFCLNFPKKSIQKEEISRNQVSKEKKEAHAAVNLSKNFAIIFYAFAPTRLQDLISNERSKSPFLTHKSMNFCTAPTTSVSESTKTHQPCASMK